ncbi:MAG: hypothetical protein KDC92_01135 [Bacteroidetes bacterium]|nr:hypothetical protein [Bacteroidota bacterium]
MKHIFTAALLLVTTALFAQKKATTIGTFEKSKQRSEYYTTLGAHNGNVLIGEGVSLGGGLKVSTRVFSVHEVDRKTLNTIRERQFDDISMNFTEAKYSYINAWKLKNTIGVLVMENATAEVKLLNIDAGTLELSSRIETVYSISQQYEKDADELLKLFRKKMYYNTLTAKSLNEKYIHMGIITNGDDVKPVLSSILINESCKVEHTKQIAFKTDYYLTDKDVHSAVSDNGSVVFTFSIGDYKKIDYIDLKPGFHMMVMSKEGDIKGWSELTLANGPGDAKRYSVNLVSAIKDNTLYLMGYEGERDGYAVGVIDLASIKPATQVQFVSFSDELKASWKSVEGSQYQKALQNVKSNNSNYVEDGLIPNNISILQNGNLILTGNYTYKETKTTESGTTTKYVYKNVQVSCFSPEGKLLFEKLIDTEHANFNPYNHLCFVQTAYEINGKIAIFLNDDYDGVEGIKLQPGLSNSKTFGTIIFIEQDGSKWNKIGMNMADDLRKLHFYSSSVLKINEQEFFIPAKIFNKNNTQYVKVDLD